MGGRTAVAVAAFVGWARAGRACAPSLARASRRDPQLAVSVVDGAHAAGVARAMGVTPRPRRIVCVTAGLRGGGAEAMLARLVTAEPRLADDITVVSLLPDIVQGWMYHGDLAALVALVMSGRRRQTHLVWGIRCSDMDLRRYGLGLRLAVKACTLLSRW